MIEVNGGGRISKEIKVTGDVWIDRGIWVFGSGEITGPIRFEHDQKWKQENEEAKKRLGVRS